MRPLGWITTALLLFLSTIVGGPKLYAEESAALKVISPKEYTLAREFILSVVLQVDTKEVDAIKLQTSLEEKQIDINQSKHFYCKAVSLTLGENRIAIRAYKDDRLVDEAVRHIYVTSPVYAEFKYPPKKYVKQFFHTDANEAACRQCHDMSVNEIKGVAFIDVTESNCYLCHKQLTKEKYAHAPAVNWLCTSCHNGEVSSDNKAWKGRSKYLAPEPVNKLCFRCHKKNYKLWKSYRFRHEPLDSGRCNKCHNSHASPYKMFVRKPADQICLGCHKDKHLKAKRRGSACEGTSEGKHCIKCHTPHASNKRFFLQDAKERNATKRASLHQGIKREREE